MGGFGGNGCVHMMSLSTFQRQATAIFVFTCLARSQLPVLAISVGTDMCRAYSSNYMSFGGPSWRIKGL